MTRQQKSPSIPPSDLGPRVGAPWPDETTSAKVSRARLGPPDGHERIVAIVAPAGYGKTTLARDWYEQLARQSKVLWIGLDAAWRDSAYFERSLLQALGQADAGSGTPFHATANTQSSVLTLLAALRLCQQPLTVFIDDVHELRQAPSLAILNHLLLSAPDHIRWVVCSRDAMGLDLSSLTARHQVRWITQRELQFEAQEVHDLIRLAWPASTEDDIDRILAMTEGWPALVQLALASPDGLHPRSGMDANVLMDSFIYERFFKQLNAEQQKILFAMAAVGEFTPQLLEALGLHQAQQAIAVGVARGILQARGRLGSESLYILHPLLAERALEGLASASDGDAQTLRLRSAQWWRARGEMHRAVRMALATDNAQLASAYLLECADQLVLVEGRHETFLDLLAQIERHACELAPTLMSHAAWSWIFLRRYPEAEGWLTRIETICAQQETPQAKDVLHTTSLQRAVMAGLRDDATQAETYARQWLTQAGNELTIYHGAAHGVLAFAEKCHSRFQNAMESLRLAQQVFEAVRSPYALLWAHALTAVTLLKAGRHRDALADTAAALSKFPVTAAGAAGQVAVLRAVRAYILYERGQLAEALIETEAALPLLPHQGVVDSMIAGYLAAVRLQATRGDLSAALDAAAEGERVGATRDFPRLQLTMVAERALLLLRAGDVDSAVRMATEHGLVPQQPTTHLHRDKAERLWVRVELARQQPERALPWVEASLARAQQTQQSYKLAELLMLRARVLARLGQQQEAEDVMIDSLRLAATHGYQRLYLDEGPEVMALLRTTAERPRAPTAALAYARAMLDIQAPAPQPTPQVAPALAPPTERERQILQLAAEGLSNSEVAAQLVLTEGTVKWHLHNLYAKLGVRNRTGALKAARACGWLDQP